MKISLDNGKTFLTAKEAMPEIRKRNIWWEVLHKMEDGKREEACVQGTGFDPREIMDDDIEDLFDNVLTYYLEIATSDLIIE